MALRMPTQHPRQGGGATGAVREYIWLPETEIAPASADAVWASEAPGKSARSQVDRMPLVIWMPSSVMLNEIWSRTCRKWKFNAVRGIVVPLNEVRRPVVSPEVFQGILHYM